MKRLLALVLALSLLLSLTGCMKSEAAVAADELILAVGTVSLESEEAIAEAEAAVAALSEREQGSLDNLALLEEARKTLDELIAQRIEMPRLRSSWI